MLAKQTPRVSLAPKLQWTISQLWTSDAKAQATKGLNVKQLKRLTSWPFFDKPAFRRQSYDASKQASNQRIGRILIVLAKRLFISLRIAYWYKLAHHLPHVTQGNKRYSRFLLGISDAPHWTVPTPLYNGMGVNPRIYTTRHQSTHQVHTFNGFPWLSLECIESANRWCTSTPPSRPLVHTQGKTHVNK